MPRSAIPIGGVGKRWRVRTSTKPLRNAWGFCDYDNREIVLCKSAAENGVDREVLIHELLHKIMPFLDEDCVKLAAIELDDALDACGY